MLIADPACKLIENVQQIDSQGFDLLTFYKKYHKAQGTNFLLFSNDPQKTFRKIKEHCQLIKAAGGLVENEEGEYLFIFRNGKWDLPKGKVEKGEKMKQAALREVEEECGIDIHQQGDKLCKTYHIYEAGSKLVLKKTNWYAMRVKGRPSLSPQTEEGITEAVWINPAQISEKRGNTFPLIIHVLEVAGIG